MFLHFYNVKPIFSTNFNKIISYANHDAFLNLFFSLNIFLYFGSQNTSNCPALNSGEKP